MHLEAASDLVYREAFPANVPPAMNSAHVGFAPPPPGMGQDRNVLPGYVLSSSLQSTEEENLRTHANSNHSLNPSAGDSTQSFTYEKGLSTRYSEVSNTVRKQSNNIARTGCFLSLAVEMTERNLIFAPVSQKEILAAVARVAGSYNCHVSFCNLVRRAF